MFNTLSNRLTQTIKRLKGETRLTSENIKDTLREVRRALLEADVSLEVIKTFLSNIEQQYQGQNVAESLTPGQQIVKIIHQELINIIGNKQAPLNTFSQPPCVILLAGLQGVGKTTSAAKLAKKLSNEKKRVLLSSSDVYRPAAIEQLKILAEQAQIDFFENDSNDPYIRAELAKNYAQKHIYDILIIDTAGRLSIDQAMMAEIQSLQKQIQPIETLFVADSQQGQDAVNVAKQFSQQLNLTGLIFTKIDGDTRGGAILTVSHATGKPIKLISTGEKLEDIQDFHPERIASRILGMGDVLSLIEELEQKVDIQKSENLAKKIKSGNQLDFNDMLEQFQQISKMGGMQSMLDKLPGIGGLGKLQNALNNQQIDEKKIAQQKAIILSMTPQERSNPQIIKGSRKRRISMGSGTNIQLVNQLIKQQKEMKTMMKKMKNKNFARQMAGMMPGKMSSFGQ